MYELIYCPVPFVAARSSAYTVATILIQLQSFLFEENAIPQDYGGPRRNFSGSKKVAAARECAAAFVCPGCSHGSVMVQDTESKQHATRSVWPPLSRVESVC